MVDDSVRQILDVARRLENKLDELNGSLAALATRVAVIEAGELERRTRDLEANHATVRGQLMVVAAGVSLLVTALLKVLHVV